MNPTISILVPIYNVERYLPQCLDSLINQTFTDLEIICINDGSTDHSLDIIKEYQAKDPRIVLLDKPNSGYGDSMNQGLKKAKGEYIGILESDDWLELDAYEKLYQLAEARKPDVVKANYFAEKNGKSTKITAIDPQDSNKILNPRQNPEIFRLAPTIWTAIYRRSFLKKNRIDFLPTPGASYQDTGFNFKVWAEAESVILTSDAFVHYRLDNINSSVNNPGKMRCVVDEYIEIETYLTERGQFAELGSLMAATKFRNYHWNFQRLSPALAQEFYTIMRREFLAAAEEGILDRAYFSRSEWFALQMILKHPKLAYCLLRLRAKLHRA